MRSWSITIALCCCGLFVHEGLATASNLYVSPSGSDANPGTAAAPWATLQKAADSANPGDIINVFPGTYRPVAARGYGVRITRSGTNSARITLKGEGGRPVLDCSGLSPSATSDVYCFLLQAEWWIIKDLDVTGAKQGSGGGLAGIGVLLSHASHNVLERVRSYGNQGTGIFVGYGSVSSHNLLLNCDSFDNYDPLSTIPGGNADGFGGGSTLAGSEGNVIIGARSWHNSDDGFDLWKSEAAWVIRNSWAWANGYGAGGNGNGFKLGRNDSGPRHTVCNCVAFNNRMYGFDTNGASGTIAFLNNTAYANGSRGFAFSTSWLGVVVPHYTRNNISIGSPYPITPVPAPGDQAFNTWDLPVTGTSGDFLSVDVSLALAPRNADGSLPTNDLFRLASGSDLIDRGVNVGTSYLGVAPDLGAYEFGGAPVGCSVAGMSTLSPPRNLRIVP